MALRIVSILHLLRAKTDAAAVRYWPEDASPNPYFRVDLITYLYVEYMSTYLHCFLAVYDMLCQRRGLAVYIVLARKKVRDYLIRSNTEFHPAGQFHSMYSAVPSDLKGQFNFDPRQCIQMSEAEAFATQRRNHSRNNSGLSLLLLIRYTQPGSVVNLGNW